MNTLATLCITPRAEIHGGGVCSSLFTRRSGAENILTNRSVGNVIRIFFRQDTESSSCGDRRKQGGVFLIFSIFFSRPFPSLSLSFSPRKRQPRDVSTLDACEQQQQRSGLPHTLLNLEWAPSRPDVFVRFLDSCSLGVCMGETTVVVIYDIRSRVCLSSLSVDYCEPEI